MASIREPSNNDLRIVVVEGKVERDPIETDVGPGFPVAPDKTSRAFAITWWAYVAYSVRNESYWREEVGTIADGSPFGIRENSAFLKYVAETTFASDDYPGPLVHTFLHTEWHCIDVVGVGSPEVTEISASQVVWDLVDRPSV